MLVLKVTSVHRLAGGDVEHCLVPLVGHLQQSVVDVIMDCGGVDGLHLHSGDILISQTGFHPSDDFHDCLKAVSALEELRWYKR